ncbi:MAG: acyltransferase domain-containing protein, partial [Myxococcales bacterium]|nr:acyltransferase domain-containing protein [Myxococcales bacterium]
KTNLGHLEAASGMAGLIKTTLALRHGVIPPNLHFESPNPNIDFDRLRLKITSSALAWPRREGPRLAGVSSFGFGGTNAHVALSSAPGSLRIAAQPQPVSAPVEDHPLVFVFPGQGGQWVGMAQALLHREPEFRAAIEACDAALLPVMGWSVLHRLCGRAPLEAPAIIQPLIFSVQVALCRTLAAQGVHPTAVLGQSMGEVAAAHVAGHLSLPDAALVIGTRARLATERLGTTGAMAVVELGSEALQRLPPGLSIAGMSSPLRTLVAGDPDAIDAAARDWEQRGVRCTRVRVTYASHSPHVEPILGELETALAGVRPLNGSIPWWSTTDGVWAKPRSANARYWVRNLREPFDLVTGIREANREKAAIFVEIGPHPVLLRSLQELGIPAGETLACMFRDQDEHADLHELIDSLSARGLARPAEESKPTIVPVTATSAEGLRKSAAELRDFLDRNHDIGLADVAWTELRHRQHHPHRAALVVEDRESLLVGLGQLVAGGDGPSPNKLAIHSGRTHEGGNIAFVFPGQG